MANPIFGMKAGPSTAGRLLVNIGYEGKSFSEVSEFVKNVPQELLENLIPLWKRIQPVIKKSLLNTFATEGHGKWQALSKNYLKSKVKRESAYPTTKLKLTGKMWKAATEEDAEGHFSLLAKDHMQWGINLDEIPYARRHDMGWMKTPQREFMRLFPEDMPLINEELENYVRRGIIRSRDAAFLKAHSERKMGAI